MLDGVLRTGIAKDKEPHIHLRRSYHIEFLDKQLDELKIQRFRPDNDRTGSKIWHDHNLWRLGNFFSLSILHHGLFRPSVYIEQCLGQALRVGFLQRISPKFGFAIHDSDSQIIYES